MTNSKFIKMSNEQIKKQSKEHFLFNRVLLFIKDPLPSKINIQNVISQVEASVPSELAQGIDYIFVGHFDEFVKRDVNALYLDGAIYVTNRQSSDQDMVDDIIHELAHSVEEAYGLEIYSDGMLEREFISRRVKLRDALVAAGYHKEMRFFTDPEYSSEFDKFLYKEVGYTKLSSLSSTLFISPYAVTSLREYFAVGFVEFFYKHNIHILKKISPQLYLKLDNLQDMSHNL